MQIQSTPLQRPGALPQRPLVHEPIPSRRRDDFNAMVERGRAPVEQAPAHQRQGGAFALLLGGQAAPEPAVRPTAAAALLARQGVDLLTRRASAARPAPSAEAGTGTAHEQALKAAYRFLSSLEGHSDLERKLRSYDEQILREATLDRPGHGPPSAMDSMRQQLAFNQQLNLRYLAIQEKLNSGTQSLLSNLMKRKHDAIREVLNRQY